MAVRDIAVGLLLLFHTWGVWAAMEVNMEDRVEVIRGDTAQINCMFTSDEGIGGVVIQWFYVTRSGERVKIYYQDSTMKVVDRDTPYTDRISVNWTGATGEVVLTINDVQLEDELEFICLIRTLSEGVGEGRTKLKVFVKPEHPTIEGVQRGISIMEDVPSKIGTCEVKNGYPKPNITWHRNGVPLHSNEEIKVMPSSTLGSSGLFSVTSELSMMVNKEDKDAKFHCEASYFLPGETRMTETNSINITVYYPSTAVKVWVESPKGKIKEGDRIELHCRGNGNTPSSAFSIRHNNEDTSLESNMLVLNDVTRLNSGDYECVCLDTDTYDEIIETVSVFVNYLDPAVVEPKGRNELVQGGELTATCNALSSLQTAAAWFKDGQEVSKGHTLSLKDATFDTSGTYMCVVTVPEIEGMETKGMLQVYVQSPPEIKKPDNTEMEESFENTVELKCLVRGLPTPSVTWTTSDGKDLETVSQQETKEGVLLSTLSLKVTSDITAVCNALNDFGTDTLAFNIKAITHTSTSATTTTTTTSSTTTTTISSTTVKAGIANPPQKVKTGGNGVIIAVIIICILLLAILGSVLYYLYKKGKICGRSGKQDLTKDKSNKDIVVEMKSDNTEEAVLLGVNGEKQPRGDQ